MHKIVIFGDSISTPQIGNGGYQKKLQSLLQPDLLLNFAVAGSGAASCTPDNILDILQCRSTDCADADAVILWHGTNDWYWGSPIGALNTYDPSTYLGALERSAERLRTAAPNALLVFATPLYRFEMPSGGDAAGDAWFTPNQAGATQADYDLAVRLAARTYGISLAETRVLSGFCRQNSARFLPDRVHPGQEGCDILANIFAEHIARHLALRKI